MAKDPGNQDQEQITDDNVVGKADEKRNSTTDDAATEDDDEEGDDDGRRVARPCEAVRRAGLWEDR